MTSRLLSTGQCFWPPSHWPRNLSPPPSHVRRFPAHGDSSPRHLPVCGCSGGTPAVALVAAPRVKRGEVHCPCCGDELTEPPPWIASRRTTYCERCAWLVMDQGKAECPTHDEPPRPNLERRSPSH